MIKITLIAHNHAGRSMILGGGQRDGLGSGKAMPLVLGNYWSCEVNSTVTKNEGSATAICEIK